MAPMTSITTSVGVSASKDLVTAGGTWSGMVILNLEFAVKRYTFTAKNVTTMPTNRPPEPRLAIGSTNPEAPAASAASAGMFTGLMVSRNAMTDRTPPCNASRSNERDRL